jgi:hypothetical protein
MSLLYLFIIIPALKLLINIPKYFAARRYLNKYMEWLTERNSNLIEYKSQVIKLIKDAGVKDTFVPSVDLAGFGYVRTGQASVLENFPNNREDIAEFTYKMFRQAIGVYRSRIFETFNPLYWLEFIINLPKQILIYLGVSSENFVVKVSQLIWWFFGATFGFLYTLYKTETETILKNLINKLFQ